MRPAFFLAAALALATAPVSAQPISYTKTNASAELKRVGNKLTFSIASVVGQNSCELEGTAEQVDAERFSYTSSDAGDKCVAMLNTKGGKLSVTTKGCESQCGMNAAGSMDGVYAMTNGPRACAKAGEPLACETEDHAKADKALNVAYKDAMARLSPDAKAKLRNEQRAWIKTRDKECGDQMGQARVIACERDMTITRTAEIQRF